MRYVSSDYIKVEIPNLKPDKLCAEGTIRRRRRNVILSECRGDRSVMDPQTPVGSEVGCCSVTNRSPISTRPSEQGVQVTSHSLEGCRLKTRLPVVKSLATITLLDHIAHMSTFLLSVDSAVSTQASGSEHCGIREQIGPKVQIYC